MKISLNARLGPAFSRLWQMTAAAIFVAAWGISIDSQPAYACSCVRPESATAERDRATAVFTGEVTSITDGDMGYIVEFDVTENWKAAETDTIQINTAGNSAACGYAFEVGRQYLVYAHGEENDLGVTLCSRTAQIDSASEDIVELGGSAPVAPVGERSPGCQSIS